MSLGIITLQRLVVVTERRSTGLPSRTRTTSALPTLPVRTIFAPSTPGPPMTSGFPASAKPLVSSLTLNCSFWMTRISIGMAIASIRTGAIQFRRWPAPRLKKSSSLAGMGGM